MSIALTTSLLLASSVVASVLAVTTENIYSLNYYPQSYEVSNILLTDDLFEDDYFTSSLEEHLISEFGKEFLENLDQARIYDAKITSLFPQDRLGETIYPNFIGGIYYNSYGNLVLQLVEENIYENSVYEKVNSLRAFGIVVDYATFPYNYLNRVINTIERSIFNGGMPESVQWTGTNTSLNRVQVALFPYNEYEKSRFLSEVSSSKSILFLEGEPLSRLIATETDFISDNSLELELEEERFENHSFVPFNITVRHGMPLSVSGLGTFSVGYRVRSLNNDLGFITTWHTGLRTGNVIQGLGTVRTWSDTGNVDAAFIATNTSVTLSNQNCYNQRNFKYWSCNTF
ncbi:MAG: hypothetical protein FWF50_00130 [Defluviitaleaceae bacterium]|nr:hypothetical protein [Defluviitaleaceae bacterium]